MRTEVHAADHDGGRPTMRATMAMKLNLPIAGARPPKAADTAIGCSRDFLDGRFVYTVISARARGLSVGVNMNPDKFCNFDCAYCEVNRLEPAREPRLDVPMMIAALTRT